MSPTEEENPDESETLGTIEPIIPEKPSVTTEENGTTETAESDQPEVHVSPTKEITTTEKNSHPQKQLWRQIKMLHQKSTTNTKRSIKYIEK